MNKTLFNVLLAIAVAIFAGAWFYSGTIKPRYTAETASDPQAIQDRIRPFADVAIVGVETSQGAAMDDQAATAIAAADAAGVIAAAEVTDTAAAEVIDTVKETATTTMAVASASSLGEDTYKTACFACHTTGVAGSPKIGDVAAWEPRIDQGIALLNEHAIKGFQGSAGIMPPKGGRVDLPDEAIIAAVAYMVQESSGP